MKKIMKFICFSLMFVISLSVVFGCGCSKPLNVSYSINLINEDANDTETKNIEIRTIVDKKFREPANTACYQKVEDKYELIPNAEGVSICYDKDGNKFEKATYKNVDKLELDRVFPMLENSGISSYTSKKSYELPENQQHSIIFEFEVRNRQGDDLFIKEFTAKDLFGDQLNESGLKKVTITAPKKMYGEQGNESDYYLLEEDSEITFKIELKGLTNKDTKKNVKDVTFNLALILK